MIQKLAPTPAIENPLRASRLNDSRDYRPEWDVASLNAGVSKSLLEEIGRIAGRQDPDPGQMIPVLLSAGGYGKTHLFGRLAHGLGDRAFFVFVGAVPDALRPLEHIRWNVIEALFRTQEQGKPTLLQQALADLFHGSFVEYMRQFPQHEAMRHQALMRALRDDSAPVLEIIAGVKNARSFRRLADSTAEAMPHVKGSVVKALVLGWSTHAHLARRWLRGESLAKDEAESVGLPEDPALPLEVLQGIAPIFQYRKPMVICCDQLDSILKDEAGPMQLAAQMMELLAGIPNQFLVLSCLEDVWGTVVKNAGMNAFVQRTRRFDLKPIKEDQAVELVSNRLRMWSNRDPELGELWPFDGDSLRHYAMEVQPTPRALIQRCAQEFDRWADGEIQAPIALVKRPPVTPQSTLFLKEWDRELETLRQDPLRAAEHIPEARLYAALSEAISLAKTAAGTLEDFHVLGYEDRVLKSTGANPKYGMRVELKNGDKTVSVVAAVSKLNGGAALHHFFTELQSAAETAAGAIWIHVRPDFRMGPGTRTAVDKAKESGKLIIYALEEHAEAFQRLECALTLLEKARSGDLELGPTPISYNQCRALILETKVIHNLDLFETLASWNTGGAAAMASSAGPAKGSKKSAPKARSPKSAARSTLAAAEKSNGEKESAPLFDSVRPSPAAEDDTAWAEQKLALAAEKLSAWGQQVEPDGFEIGPSFVRLNVKPLGTKTTFKKVSNRATDLKVSLGLDIEPIIEAHSNRFTIDIQSPHRRTVTLDKALSQAPSGKAADPLFPLGLDVAGKTHWVNLADPSDCHLLVAGTTGSGKSEFLKSILASLASRLTPDQIQFILIDPKRVTFNFTGSSPYLKHPVAYDLAGALPLVKECEQETLRRYDVLQKMQKTDVGQLEGSQTSLVPRIVLIIDEFANLMEEKETNKALTRLLKKIGSMSRAAGIHLILATQRPDSTVVPVLVRSNLPGKIALQVDSEQNSKLILDSPAAAYLLGKGDLLCKRGGSLVRAQSPMVSQSELERLLKIA